MSPTDVLMLGGMLAAWLAVLGVPITFALAADSRHSHLGTKADIESRAMASARSRE